MIESAAKHATPGKSLKLASADFTFPLLRHDKVLDLIASLEMDGVDIGLFEGRSHLWPSHEFKNAAQSAKLLSKQLSDRGLKPADVFLQLDPDFVPFAINQPDSERRRHAREKFLRTLDYACCLGSPHVTTLPGVYFEQQELADDSWRRSQDELAWRVEQAKQQKITFSVEAHVGSLAPNPQEAERMVRGVPGLTLTLDYTHFTRIGLPDAAIEPLVQYSSHFHVRGAREGRLQTSFKDNAIDYAAVLRAMNVSDYSGYLGIEYVWIDWEHCNESDNLSETILFRDFLRANEGLAMYCLGLALTLRSGAYDGYKRAHDEIWPELTAGMRANEVSMAIYRDENRLFLFAAAPTEAHWQRSRGDPVLARWDATMSQYLETDDQGRLAFTVLPKAFGFGEFA